MADDMVAFLWEKVDALYHGHVAAREAKKQRFWKRHSFCPSNERDQVPSRMTISHHHPL